MKSQGYVKIIWITHSALARAAGVMYNGAHKAMSTLKDQLFDEILQARQRVYAVGDATPMQELHLPGINAAIFAKREDLGPIKAYKWRGAYNCMAKLTPEQRAGGVVAASAGNHGQGVALAARRLGCKAHIFIC